MNNADNNDSIIDKYGLFKHYFNSEDEPTPYRDCAISYYNLRSYGRSGLSFKLSHFFAGLLLYYETKFSLRLDPNTPSTNCVLLAAITIAKFSGFEFSRKKID